MEEVTEVSSPWVILSFLTTCDRLHMSRCCTAFRGYGDHLLSGFLLPTEDHPSAIKRMKIYLLHSTTTNYLHVRPKSLLSGLKLGPLLSRSLVLMDVSQSALNDASASALAEALHQARPMGLKYLVLS